jgi:signal transduction histidine kinase
MVMANGFSHEDGGDDDLEAGERMLHKLRQYISRFLAQALRHGPDKWHHATNDLRLSMAEAVLALQRMESDHHSSEPTIHPHADIAATAIVRLAVLVDQLRSMQEEEAGESEEDEL